MLIGGTIGSTVEERFGSRMRRDDAKVLMVAGAAAGVAAVFKAPLTGVIFALEVPYRSDLARRALLPSLVAAGSAYVTYVAIVGTKPLLATAGSAPFDLRDLGGGLALGLICGVLARLGAFAIGHAKNLSLPPVARVAMTAAALVVLAPVAQWWFGASLHLGPGYAAIEWAADPHRTVIVLVGLFSLRAPGHLAGRRRPRYGRPVHPSRDARRHRRIGVPECGPRPERAPVPHGRYRRVPRRRVPHPARRSRLRRRSHRPTRLPRTRPAGRGGGAAHDGPLLLQPLPTQRTSPRHRAAHPHGRRRDHVAERRHHRRFAHPRRGGPLDAAPEPTLGTRPRRHELRRAPRRHRHRQDPPERLAEPDRPPDRPDPPPPGRARRSGVSSSPSGCDPPTARPWRSPNKTG